MGFDNVFSITIEEEICGECGASKSYVLTSDGSYSCSNCGLVDSTFVPLVLNHQFSDGDFAFAKPGRSGWDGCPPDGGGDCAEDERTGAYPERRRRKSTFAESIQWKRICSRLNGRGRYKPIFHWNERIAQMRLEEPPIPEPVMDRIVAEAWYHMVPGWDNYHKGYGVEGRFWGPPTEFTRATVVMILKKLSLSHYCERWKTILATLDPERQMVIPSRELIDRLEPMYVAVETEFWKRKEKMPRSHIRTKDKKVRVQVRHNIIPFNYLFRKLCEAVDVRSFHGELPLLRSAAKLHHLDDIMGEICDSIGIKFTRSVVIKRPKMKRKV